MRNHRKDPGKYIGSFTARGQASEQFVETYGPIRIRLFDGKFDTAYKVREFHVWPSNYASSSNPDVVGKLMTSPNGTDTADNFHNASDSRQLGWAGFAGATDQVGADWNLVDPENLVVEDLWVYVRGSNDLEDVNYMIVLDKYDITESLGAVSMAKDRARESQKEWIDQ